MVKLATAKWLVKGPEFLSFNMEKVAGDKGSAWLISSVKATSPYFSEVQSDSKLRSARSKEEEVTGYVSFTRPPGNTEFGEEVVLYVEDGSFRSFLYPKEILCDAIIGSKCTVKLGKGRSSKTVNYVYAYQDSHDGNGDLTQLAYSARTVLDLLQVNNPWASAQSNLERHAMVLSPHFSPRWNDPASFKAFKGLLEKSRTFKFVDGDFSNSDLDTSRMAVAASDKRGSTLDLIVDVSQWISVGPKYLRVKLIRFDEDDSQSVYDKYLVEDFAEATEQDWIEVTTGRL